MPALSEAEWGSAVSLSPSQALRRRLERRQGKSSSAQILLQLLYIFKKSRVQPDCLGADDILFQVIDKQSLFRCDIQFL